MPLFFQIIDINVLKSDCRGGDKFNFAVSQKRFVYRRNAANEQAIRVGDSFRRNLSAGECLNNRLLRQNNLLQTVYFHQRLSSFFIPIARRFWYRNRDKLNS